MHYRRNPYGAQALPIFEGDDMEVHQRLTALETNLIHLDKCIDDAKTQIRALQRTVWIASGAVGVFIGAVELLLKVAHP